MIILKTEILDKLFKNFTDFTREKNGEIFTSFHTCRYFDEQEKYKEAIYKEARETIRNGKWKQEDVDAGTGKIFMIDYWDKTKLRHAATKSTLEKSVELDNVVLSAITKMELMPGATNKTDMGKIRKKPSRFNIALINNDFTLQYFDLLQSSDITICNIVSQTKSFFFTIKNHLP